jgi:hypothetical protein
MGHSMGELMPPCTGLVKGISGDSNSWGCISSAIPNCAGFKKGVTWNGTSWVCADIDVRCGNGYCVLEENCSNCPADCGACPICGDSSCNGAETCNSCPADCGACPICGDSSCNGAETCNSCPADCGACPPSCPGLSYDDCLATFGCSWDDYYGTCYND